MTLQLLMMLEIEHLTGHQLWIREPLADAAPSCVHRALAVLTPGSLLFAAWEGVLHLVACPAGWAWLAVAGGGL